ncbi:hypothetical protein LZ32DRAFT_605663 [Colletotrichum eremochloae]|nr:hypothetical protein LZ32DRAFT_605663 [Colletotrichum eremochloae]
METLKEWFDRYLIVIVPFETGKTPITPIRRWRVDVVSSDIRNSVYFNGQTGEKLDGKELKFLNNNRPVARFLYFHFIMALIRIKNTNRPNWQDVWARYYETRPFPTPGPYMRKSMLLALASHYSTTDLDVVNSWLKDNGFETSLQLTPDETTEAARRVLEAVEVKSASSEAEVEDVSESDSSEDEDQDQRSDED